MNTDRWTTILSFITALLSLGAGAAGSLGAPSVAFGLGLGAAVSHTASGYLTNKPSTS